MLKIYKTVDEKGLFRETDKIEKGVWINLVNPSTGEINNLINSIGINEEFIKYCVVSTSYSPKYRECSAFMLCYRNSSAFDWANGL